MGRSVIIIYNNININITIPSEIDVIPLTVCVDRNPISSLLNLVRAFTWGFEIILW
jgi:hypothetical protein